MKPITWSQIQKQKKTEEKKKLFKDILIVICIVVGFLLFGGIAGGTFPY